MGKHTLGILILITTIATLVASGIQHTTATLNDKVYALTNGVGCVLAFGMAVPLIIVAAFKKWIAVRNYSIAIALIAVVVAIVPFAVASYRKDATTKYLSKVYSALSNQGPPFPIQPDILANSDSKSFISHGYWVADDKRSFEVYFHDGSDSYTMAYPDGRWQWRGNRYQGPNPQPQSENMASLMPTRYIATTNSRAECQRLVRAAAPDALFSKPWDALIHNLGKYVAHNSAGRITAYADFNAYLNSIDFE